MSDRLPDGRPNWLTMKRSDFDADVPPQLFDLAPEATGLPGDLLAEVEDLRL